MFGTVRKHSQALWIPIIIVIVVSFVIYFTPGVDPFENRGPRQSESDSELSFAREQIILQQALNMSNNPQMRGFIPPRELVISQIAAQFPPKDLNGDQETDISGLDYQAHLRLLRLRKAESVGIMVSDNMIKARMEQMFSNPNDKKFSITLYNNFLESYQTDDRAVRFLAAGKAGEIQLEEFIREDIALRLLDQLMTRSIGFFSNQTISGQVAEENRKYTAQAIFFSTSNRVSEVTNFSTTATNFTQHYQSVSDQYFVEPKRKATYVFFSITNYMEAAKKQINFEELITERRKLHNTSTNVVDHLTDASGTNKLTGAKLDDALVDDVFKSNQIKLETKTLPQAKDEATAFRKKLFVDGAQWDLARLRAEAAKEKLPVQSTIVSAANENSVLPQKVVNAVFSIPDKAKGKLSTSAIEVKSTPGGQFNPQTLAESGQGYYVFGLEDIIPGRTPKYIELSKDEQDTVKKSFVEKEVKRLANEEAKDWRDTVTELMASGSSFTDATKDSKYQIINLPAMTLTERDVNATALKELATVSEIQSSISALERENRGNTNNTNWLSSYNPSTTEGVGGFIVHVSKVEAGDAPQPEELRAFANQQRQMARNFNSSSMADRFGLTPVWLDTDIKILNSKLILQGLLSSLINLPYQYETTLQEYQDLSKTIGQIESGETKLSGNITLNDLKEDYTEAENKLIRLRSNNADALPRELRKANQTYLQLTGDTKTYTKEIEDALEAANEFDLEILKKEIDQNPERIFTAIANARQKEENISNQLKKLREDPKKTATQEMKNMVLDSAQAKKRLTDLNSIAKDTLKKTNLTLSKLKTTQDKRKAEDLVKRLKELIK